MIPTSIPIDPELNLTPLGSDEFSANIMWIADSTTSVARRLRLFLILPSVLLAFAFTLTHAHDSEPLISGEPAVKQRAPAAASSNWPFSMLMLAALTWALLEYAQFVLLLMTDEDAVISCYQQRCSAAQMLTGQIVKGEEAHELKKEPAEGELLQPPKTYGRLPSDHVSTNIIRTPSQLSDESDEKHHYHTRGERGTPEILSICTCEEEDYLVAIEDDVRKPDPCAVHKPVRRQEGRVKVEKEGGEDATHLKASQGAVKVQEDHGEGSAVKSASPEMPMKTNEAGESDAAADHKARHEQAKEEHHLKQDLLPAVDSTPIDAL